MTNLTCWARSNSFKVADADNFTAWVDDLELEAQKNDDGTFTLFAEEGFWPSWRFDEPDDPYDDPHEVDFVAELAAHLAEGEVAVLMQAGAEGLRYILGTAVAIHSDGRLLTLELDDIYGRVKETWGVEPTLAEY
jgi:hypothetical protein